MRALIRLHNFGRFPLCPQKLLYSTVVEGQGQNEQPKAHQEEEFRPLEFYPKPVRQARRKRQVYPALPPRYKKMPPTQDWPSVWPVARTFHPASVPLPLHQGLVPSNKSVPNKFGNLELMKIPNFLHLTPPAIQRHCEALKKFCTPWPSELIREKEIDEEFPMQVTTNDYCHSTPSIRDPRARIVTLKVKVSALKFDEHAKDKFLRLVGDRYDVKTDILTIVTDSCPLKSQNLDYALYLLTALYHESWNKEDWEDDKIEDDGEKYIWENSVSQGRIAEILANIAKKAEASKPEYLTAVSPDVLKPDTIAAIEPVKKFSQATLDLHNKGEDKEAIEEYGKSVRSLLNLPPMV